MQKQTDNDDICNMKTELRIIRTYALFMDLEVGQTTTIWQDGKKVRTFKRTE